MVVGMTAERARDGNAAILRQIHRRAHIVQSFCLKHEMQQALRHRDLAEGDRMVARIAMHESQRQLPAQSMPSLQFDEITDAHSEHVAIKVQAARAVIYSNHDVTETHRSGLETGERTRRFEGFPEIHQRPKVSLSRNPAGIFELYKLKHTSQFGLFGRAGNGLDAIILELDAEFLQRALIGYFPSDEGDIVFAAMLDDEPVMVFVHPHVEAL